jgi:type II restriction enzyme
MATLTTADLVNQIALLDLTKTYRYIGGRSLLRIRDVMKPEGGIVFDTVDGNNKVIPNRRIPPESLATVAAICSRKPNFPLQFDRIFNAGGNTRSALETMLAYTPHFFVTYPERLDTYTGKSRRDLRHMMWCPDETHPIGERAEKEYSEVINEVETGLDFGKIDLDLTALSEEFESIEARRIHTQMQIALVRIGNVLKFRTWIARNDRAVAVEGRQLGTLPGVIASLDNVQILYNAEAKRNAALIDAIWFGHDERTMPAIFEIEHSTGVTSGMDRMAKLQSAIPALTTRYVIVAPDDLRSKVVREANQPIFSKLQVSYLSYSRLRELYGLMQKYELTGCVDERFVYAFMEEVFNR